MSGKLSKEIGGAAPEPSRHLERLPEWFNDLNSVGQDRIIEFYSKFTKDFERPLWAGRVEVPELKLAGLLFVPHHDDLEAYHWPWSAQEHGISLYQRGRFVADPANLLPKYLGFMKGVLNCAGDLSPETLRQPGALARLRAALVDSCFAAFAALERGPAFAQFHAAFMPYLRLGVREDSSRREQIGRLCRFRLSSGGERWFSLDECRERCGGEEIPFAAGASRADIASLPEVRQLEAAGREVVYVTDPPFDAHFLCELGDWRGTPFRACSGKRAEEPARRRPHAADEKTRGGMVKIGGQFPAAPRREGERAGAAAAAEQPEEPQLPGMGLAGEEARGPSPLPLERLPVWASGADAEGLAAPGRLHALFRALCRHERALLHCAFTVPGSPACMGFLFIPHHDSFGVVEAGTEEGSSLRIYSEGRFVASLPELLPRWLRFLKCAVNVVGPLSPETLRSNAFGQRLADELEEQAFRAFHRLAHAPDRLTYNQFHGAFAPRLRMALHDRPQRREQIAALFRFHSSRFPDEACVSLDDYIARMPLEQHAIYFAVGKTSDDIASLPSVRELLKSKGFEVLFAWDPPFSKTAMVDIARYKGRDLVPLLMVHENAQRSPRAARLEGAIVDQKLLKQEHAAPHFSGEQRTAGK